MVANEIQEKTLQQSSCDWDRWGKVTQDFRDRCCQEPFPTFKNILELARSFPQDEQADMLANLVCEHLRSSWSTGRRQLFVEDYLSEFGEFFKEFKSHRTIPVDIAICEFVERHRIDDFADHPALEEYERRFVDRTDIQNRLYELCLDDNRYVRIERQGQGGLGCVWRAYDMHLKRYVAIKEPAPSVAGNQKVVNRLAKEARITAGLDHPGIVSVHELKDANGLGPYYVMRLIEGETLRKHINLFHSDQLSTKRNRRIELAGLLQAFVNVCEAIAYAHAQGVLHGDLKPENIVLGKFSETVVLDWGLAKIESGTTKSSSSDHDKSPKDGAISVATEETPVAIHGSTLESHGVRGTPGYMSPEQSEGRLNRSADVFGLGAVLYEILTCQAPYARQTGQNTQRLWQRVQTGDFIHPREIRKEIPKPLEAICLKAMDADPEKRYLAASDVADDVRRWLADEPVSVVLESLYHRFARFVRRNIGVSVLIFLGVLAGLFGLAYASYSAIRQQSRLELLDKAKTQIALQEISWREKSDADLIAAAENRVGEDVRDLMVANAQGMDAEVVTQWSEHANRIAFSPDDSQLLLSHDSGTQLLSIDGKKRDRSLPGFSGPGFGPIGFSKNGEPQILAFSNPWEASLITLDGTTRPNRLLLQIDNPKHKELEPRWQETPDEQKAEQVKELELLSRVTSEMHRVVAAYKIPSSNGYSFYVGVWDGQTGKALGMVEQQASALAISEDGKFVAIGSADGRVQLRRVHGLELVKDFQVTSSGINALALGPEPGRNVSEKNELGRRNLAVGDQFGKLTIWNLHDDIPLNIIRGVVHQINSVRFSANGATLATASHSRIKLWDVGTGQNVLDIPDSGFRHDVAFSHFGNRLAIPGFRPDRYPNETTRIYEIENGDGISQLRGLAAPAAQTVFSPNGKLVAGISNDWKIGIWDVQSKNLLHIFQAPSGVAVDNLAMQFTPDNKSFLFSAGEKLTKWDLESGDLVKPWPLPIGLQDQISFDGDRILLYRCETKSETKPPFRENPAELDPRVCRIREVRNDGTAPTIAEFRKLGKRIFNIKSSYNGRYVAVDGITLDGERHVAVLNGHTGEFDRFYPAFHRSPMKPLIADTENLLVIYSPRRGGPTAAVIRLDNGETIGDLPRWGSAVSIDGNLSLRTSNGNISVFNIQTRQTLFKLKTGATSNYESAFSPDSRFAAWANLDGTISLCDLPAMNARLKRIGYGWDKNF